MKYSVRKSRFGATLLPLAGVCVCALQLSAADWPQWRGPQRDGTSVEKGLLREWPKAGPRLLWKIKEAGSGFSTPAVVGDRIYLLGNVGVENESVRCFSVTDGKQLWTTQLGKVGNPDQKPSYPGSRSTPTVDGDRLYALSSDGDLACLDAAKGTLRWKKSLRGDFAGKPGQWAYSESPLVDGQAVICTPGGSAATLLALNKQTGEVLWKTALPDGDEAGYASPVQVETGGVRQYVLVTQKGLVGVEAKTGKTLWRYAKAVSRFGANIPSPVVSGDSIYTSGAGTGGAIVKLTGKDGGVTAEQLFFEAKYPVSIGGAVKVGGYLYGTTGQALQCIDWATGKIQWEERAMGAAAICTADGLLYLHGENGEIALVEASPEAYREKGRFTPPELPARANQMEKAWAYPVLANGRLYVRDTTTLWCFAVK